MPINLSDTAELLIEKARETEDGLIIVTHTFGGFEVNTNSWTTGRKKRRDESVLREAISELLDKGFIYDLGRGEVFGLTTKGWDH